MIGCLCVSMCICVWGFWGGWWDGGCICNPVVSCWPLLTTLFNLSYFSYSLFKSEKAHVSVPASESISNSLLGHLQAPDQTAMAMNQRARDVLRDRSCVELPTLECDEGAQFRSSNGSCNNLERPHQVGEV